MAENSKIEWTDHTFNPWRGCTKVSPGCANCYAETLSHRNPKVLGEWGKGKPRVRASAAMWREPLKWNQAEESKRVSHSEFVENHRPRVFCASLADWLDDEVPIEWLADLLALIHATPNLDWLLLTKRPQNWSERLAACAPFREVGSPQFLWELNWLAQGVPPANVWIGTTVEDQQRADERIPHLLNIPAKVRFLSCEPLLGPVDLSAFIGRVPNITGERIDPYNFGLDWVIAGGESGPKARPMHPDWARSIRDQCAAAGVAYHFKQWGEWAPLAPLKKDGSLDFSGQQVMANDGTLYEPTALFYPDGSSRGDAIRAGHYHASLYSIYRVGKKAAGRLLDGREWNEFPKTDRTP